MLPHAGRLRGYRAQSARRWESAAEPYAATSAPHPGASQPPLLAALYDLPEVDWWYRPPIRPREAPAGVAHAQAPHRDADLTGGAVERAARRRWHRLLRHVRKLLR